MFVWIDKNKQKTEAGVGPFLKTIISKVDRTHSEFFLSVYQCCESRDIRFDSKKSQFQRNLFPLKKIFHLSLTTSVTRLGDWLDFGQLFKAIGNIYFAQISHILRHFLWRWQNLSFFKWNHFWATFIDIWRFFLVTLQCPNMFHL